MENWSNELFYITCPKCGKNIGKGKDVTHIEIVCSKCKSILQAKIVTNSVEVRIIRN